MTSHTSTNSNGHRRRQLAARIKATATHCALCHQPLNPDARWPEPNSTVIDENIPRVKGGSPYDPDNTSAMHAACNRWKSTMTLTEAQTLLAAGASLEQPLTRAQRRNILNPTTGAWEPSSSHW